MLGRHIRIVGIQLVKAALTKHALALNSAPVPGAPEQQPISTDPTAADAVPKVVATPPAT